ncbi:Forkhead-associated domain-containing protein [Citrus sinensis]|uniref:Forkhead-associated domain-containing protein n=1 Tax=Citrus sinensis TaxID=2711 RepID=A0ACB8LBZ0_CITSI|nr:Forkhead-associated domain-containing protein [Citrus sinensis]
MILHSGSGLMVVACRPSRAFLVRPNCLSSSTNTEQLRSQLDQLHTEAETTRAKASSARLRLLRLSEAAEKLKRQAAINVHRGKESDARELLFQKKKVMQAMEKSKNRIELLDELCTKLNEAISVKETQLIGNVALDLEVDLEDPSGLVRIVSPKKRVQEEKDEDKDFDPNAPKPGDNGSQVLQFSEASPLVGEEMDCQGSVDQQLNDIESELVTILNVSSLILDNKEKPKNVKVQQAMELLESVRSIRGSPQWTAVKVCLYGYGSSTPGKRILRALLMQKLWHEAAWAQPKLLAAEIEEKDL